jgi:hypothetical protein
MDEKAHWTIWPQIGVTGGRLDAVVQARLTRNSRRFSVFWGAIPMW